MTSETNKAIDTRYGALAGESCCLSCGGAARFAGVQPGEICVDLGSGRGRDVLRMAELAGPSGYAYGIDISGGMLTRARQEAVKIGIPNAAFLEAPLEALPLEDGSVDLVISNCTINHAEDKKKVWREIFRVLKPWGRFIVSDIYALRAVPEEYASDPQAVAECWAGAVTKQEYMNTIRDAGFTAVKILEESRPYQKGKIDTVSFTIAGRRPLCCCGT
jgi:arsenite methyltransferase